jgi:hypothetical protein
MVLSQSCRETVVDILKGTPSETCLSQYLTGNASISSVVVKLAKRIKDLEVENEFFRRKHNRIYIPGDDPLVVNDRSKYSDHSEDVEQLSKDIAKFTLTPTEKPSIHFGESSNMMLVLTAMGHRKEVDSTVPDWQALLLANQRRQFWDLPVASAPEIHVYIWTYIPLQHIPPAKPEVVHWDFPDDEQLMRLKDSYFDFHNLYTSLLHRPTFEKALSSKLHLRDEGFGALVLAVCALGSQFVITEGISVDSDAPPGLKWFEQLPIKHFTFGQDLSLHHLQMYCVCC